MKREVTIEVDGVRNRFDFVGMKNGKIYLYEVKNGPYARPTKNQLINIPKLHESGASFIPIGKNASSIPEFNSFEMKRMPFTGDFEVVYIHYW